MPLFFINLFKNILVLLNKGSLSGKLNLNTNKYNSDSFSHNRNKKATDVLINNTVISLVENTAHTGEILNATPA